MQTLEGYFKHVADVLEMPAGMRLQTSRPAGALTGASLPLDLLGKPLISSLPDSQPYASTPEECGRYLELYHKVLDYLNEELGSVEVEGEVEVEEKEEKEKEKEKVEKEEEEKEEKIEGGKQRKRRKIETGTSRDKKVAGKVNVNLNGRGKEKEKESDKNLKDKDKDKDKDTEETSQSKEERIARRAQRIYEQLLAIAERR